MKQLNINNRIKVTLTKEGADAINNNNVNEINELLADFPNLDTSFIKVDYKEGDVVEDSLWSVFSMLGNYFKWHTDAPFVMNEITIFD